MRWMKRWRCQTQSTMAPTPRAPSTDSNSTFMMSSTNGRMRDGSMAVSASRSLACGARVDQQIAPITIALSSDLKKLTMESRPNTRLKPAIGDSLDMSGLILSGAHRKPVWMKLPAMPARAAENMTAAITGKIAANTWRATSRAPSFCRVNWSGWAMNGVRLVIRVWAMPPPASSTTPDAAASEAQCGRSMLLATSPLRCASSSRLDVGSSVFESGSAPSAMSQLSR